MKLEQICFLDEFVVRKGGYLEGEFWFMVWDFWTASYGNAGFIGSNEVKRGKLGPFWMGILPHERGKPVLKIAMRPFFTMTLKHTWSKEMNLDPYHR